MEKCSHCGALNDNGAEWKQFTARYYEVEIMHSVCHRCSSGLFPKFYNIREYRIPGHNKQADTVINTCKELLFSNTAT